MRFYSLILLSVDINFGTFIKLQCNLFGWGTLLVVSVYFGRGRNVETVHQRIKYMPEGKSVLP